MATKEQLFDDVSVALDGWVSGMTDSLTNTEAPLEWVDDVRPYRVISEALTAANVDPQAVRAVLREGLRGFAHTIFVALDGGTHLAEHGRLYVVDADGKSIGEGLHESFVDHLLDSGRLA
ncbi:hypothetical protein [Acidovorax kalamii]|uniref:hypothetical protein n=1 Tax=Acidovorax kalamii TaxID=2004485 RepID=UPI002091AF3B|nr:hypothetical protein [Acidovorax kalamii]MCO5356069.1 hypothetical protein [Acidovorax kalamii]